jgi:hypothetical protein
VIKKERLHTTEAPFNLEFPPICLIKTIVEVRDVSSIPNNAKAIVTI